ncbi:hypothetical protein [Brevundimonas sp.]|uniref:hypothetical protein n=1 Tax=Brevundimonas sp. TaxID=1871086 RepID=UPI002C9C26FF|nr:hypothetical protein [Brevundimonas sp.]HWQ85575.1 hypothetical protein [Brevundimonas sp.]
MIDHGQLEMLDVETQGHGAHDQFGRVEKDHHEQHHRVAQKLGEFLGDQSRETAGQHQAILLRNRQAASANTVAV